MSISRRGLLGALASLPVVGRLVPAAAAPSTVPSTEYMFCSSGFYELLQDELYDRGPIMNAIAEMQRFGAPPLSNFRGEPIGVCVGRPTAEQLRQLGLIDG